MKSLFSVIVLTLLISSVPLTAALSPDEVRTMKPTAIEKALPDEHPSLYYSYAARLFFEGKKDDAVRWFYIGQLRYRIHLKARPELDPSGDPALFASLNATMGRQINEYAGGDPSMWVAQIDQALAWDEKHANKLTPKSKFPREHEEIRAGLVQLKTSLEQNVDQIREQRKKAGLENRE